MDFKGGAWRRYWKQWIQQVHSSILPRHEALQRQRPGPLEGHHAPARSAKNRGVLVLCSTFYRFEKCLELCEWSGVRRVRRECKTEGGSFHPLCSETELEGFFWGAGPSWWIYHYWDNRKRRPGHQYQRTTNFEYSTRFPGCKPERPSFGCLCRRKSSEHFVGCSRYVYRSKFTRFIYLVQSQLFVVTYSSRWWHVVKFECSCMCMLLKR